MKKIGLIVFVLSNLFLNGQNLVNNSSFELLSNCPIIGGNHSATLCVNWYNPTQDGTPDVFNICCTSTVSPCSAYTYKQLPRTGNTFTGIWCYDNSFLNLREYLHTQLSTPLVLGNYYYLKMYCVFGNFFKYACNNIGVYFSSNTIYQSGVNNYLLNYTPQIKKFNNPIISDTLNWIEITGIYQAIGNENYITIGNFKIFPNPNKGNFKIEFDENQQSDDPIIITVSNLLGQSVYSKRFESVSTLKIEINIEELVNGIYIVSLTQNNNNIGQSKLVIE
ncbi:MAG TPA: T9SS type A sorting domain-containing protein [Bacteroidia bacterium]|nr:T9SS type A sorting domain-containing protein [Bacteroidia bacterium]